MMANWVFASAHSRGGIFHSWTTWRKTMKMSFVAVVREMASGPHGPPQLAFKASIAFGV
jgi:hypothetical protein